MPMLVMMAVLCPSGATGTVFALLTSVQMAGGTLGASLSAALTHAVGVTLEDYSRLAELTVACVTLRLATLLFIGLVPRQSMEQVAADTARGPVYRLSCELRPRGGEAEAKPAAGLRRSDAERRRSGRRSNPRAER